MSHIDNYKSALQSMTYFELRYIAKEFGVENPTVKDQSTLVDDILKSADNLSELNKYLKIKVDVQKAVVQTSETPQKEQNYHDKRNNNNRRNQNDEENIEGCVIKVGTLEIAPDGYGFVRVKHIENCEEDAYVHGQKIKKHGLRRGDLLKVYARESQDNKPGAVVKIIEINNIPVELLGKRPNFDDLIPIYPQEKIKLEIPEQKNDVAIRAIDLVAPIGKGQRAMIVSPPKAGKTTLLKKIAHSITTNYPEIKLFVLLVDERPEEVTDMQRSINGEVIYSTFDEMPEHHTKAAEVLLARAKRLVEMGDDVVILMDSLTRLARAYNLTIAPTGRTLSGGIDPGALHSPKRFFGAARNIENGGSLTIVATALIDTGSKMDDVIFEEFKGTGNMEIHLDRKLQEKRIFPAIDLFKSGTRKEELLMSQNEIEGVWAIRKMLSAGDTQEAAEHIINILARTENNERLIHVMKHQIEQLIRKNIKK